MDELAVSVQGWVAPPPAAGPLVIGRYRLDHPQQHLRHDPQVQIVNVRDVEYKLLT